MLLVWGPLFENFCSKGQETIGTKMLHHGMGNYDHSQEQPQGPVAQGAEQRQREKFFNRKLWLPPG